jgi:DNA-binding winged helix-turn-helix (wHTH) protein
MDSNRYQFDDFTVDPVNRSLRRAGEALSVSNRYFDALALLLRERGQLVTKDRFMSEVWNGVPVTDEALTQCIRTLRRLLGDDAARPRFIETVPKHGYRFIAPAKVAGGPADAGGAAPVTGARWRHFRAIATAAAIGGGLAGVLGGLFYGFGINLHGGQPAPGATSILFVLLALNMIVGLAAGTGVGAGIAAAEFAPTTRWPWSLLGGAAGGFLTGGLAKLVGLDAFGLLLGQSPADMTGAPEGAILGAAVGWAAWTARGRSLSLTQSAVLGGLAASVAAILLSLCGGTLLGGSLDLLLRQFPESRVRLEAIGSIFGENGFGLAARTVTAAIEGLLFGACVVGAMVFARPATGEIRSATPGT